MRKRFFYGIVACVVFFVCVLSFSAQQDLDEGGQQAGQATTLEEQKALLEQSLGKELIIDGESIAEADGLIVGFKDKTKDKDKSEAHEKVGATLKHRFWIINADYVKLKDKKPKKAKEQYKKNKKVLYVDLNYVLTIDDFAGSGKNSGRGRQSFSDRSSLAVPYYPDDPMFGNQWALHNTGQTGGRVDADIDGPEAWGIIKGNPDLTAVVVAVIDTGVDYRHEDLASQMWVNEVELYGQPGVDDDENEYVDDIYGYDFYNYDADPMDDHNHGTHCSGIIAAAQDNQDGPNYIGITGIAPGAKIMALKFLDALGHGFGADAIKCFEYATAMNADITSNSWGGGGYLQSLKDAIIAFEGPTICAAGNNGRDTDQYPHYPSSYDCANIISVLATDHTDTKPDWSNYGETSVDIGAPGVSILSTVRYNRYEEMRGTSMATPYVAGVAALVKSKSFFGDTISTTGIIQRVLYSGDPIFGLVNLCRFGSRVNAVKALWSFNYPPEARNPRISDLIEVEKTVTAGFDYWDYEEDQERVGFHQFQWYRADDAGGTNRTAITEIIEGYPDYFIPKEMAGYYLSVEITPAAYSGTSPGLVTPSPWYFVDSAYPIVKNLGNSTLASSWASCVGEAYVTVGAQRILERGFVYATHTEPKYMEDNVVRADGSGDGQFIVFMEGLSPSTKYFAKAYARNNPGITYSDEIYFITFTPTSEDVKLHPLRTADTYVAFGWSVSVLGDHAIVGAYKHGDASGCAYIFYRNQGGPGRWGLVKKITASDAALEAMFGFSVSIFGDYAIVGAPKINRGEPGAAYIFQKDHGGANNWGELKILTASDSGGQQNGFGDSVSLSGSYAIVGATLDDERAVNAGAAYIFHRDQGGTNNWGEVKKLTALDAAAFDRFGYSVSISGDVALVGAHQDDDNEKGDESGSVYIFYRDKGGAGNWGEVKKLTASDGASGDHFGKSVSISGGYYAVVGAFAKDTGGLNAGAVYVFERNAGGAENWGEVKSIVNPDPGVEEWFGRSVCVSGTRAFVGCTGDDNAKGLNAGAAYVFDRDNGGVNNWGQVKKLTGLDTDEYDFFGSSVSVSRDTLAVGAAKAGDNHGGVYIFPVELTAFFPEVTTSEITNIGLTTATSGGTVVDTGGANVEERGVCWNIDPDNPPTLADDNVVRDPGITGDGSGPFSIDITGLPPHTACFVRAYATNDVGPSYGEVESFRTDSIPEVTTSESSNIGVFAATGGGTVVDTGGADVEERGVCWNTDPDNPPTLADDNVVRDLEILGDGAGPFSVEISGLSSGTECFVRAYATNYVGTSYGEVRSFITSNEVAKLTASDGAAVDWFGYSVSIFGDVAIVGTPEGDNTRGSAYIFYRDAGGADAWSEVVKLTASDRYVEDGFGYSVSISGDVAIVGAYCDDDKDYDSGSAYIFYRDAGGADAWREVKKLTASDGAGTDWFGYSVSISGDMAIVGAYGDDDKGRDSGSAYIFYRDAGGVGNWGEVKKLAASDGAGTDYFGYSVSVSGDVTIVGAYCDDDKDDDSGSAYIFYRDAGGADAWEEVKKVTASDGAAYDRFGYSVSISGDMAIIGAYGAAYIFYRDAGGADAWEEVKKVTASDGAAYDRFGHSVSISGDMAIIGAYGDDDKGDDSGSAYLFSRDEGGAGNWGEVAKLTASDGAAYDWFGHSVSISGDMAVIGAHGDDDKGVESGSAYTFLIPGSSARQYKLTISADSGGTTLAPYTPGDHWIDSGNSVEVIAQVVNPDCRFLGWTGDIEWPNETVTVTMNSNKTIIANFKLHHTLTVSVWPEAGGTTLEPYPPGEHEVDDEEYVDVTAQPNQGYRFLGWTGDAEGENETVRIFMDRPKRITANFRKTYTLTVNEGTGGGVEISPPNDGPYDEGTEVTLTPIPDSGYHFARWVIGETESTEIPLTITMDDDKTVTAEFKKWHTLTVIIDPVDGEGGTTLEPYPPGDHEVDEGTSVTVTAQENAGYRFSGWSGAVISPDRAITFTMDGPKTITANFVEQYTLSVFASPAEGGDVTHSPVKEYYDPGDEVQLTATANPGYRFDQWDGTGIVDPNNSSTSITMDGDKEVTAHFVEQYTLDVIASPVEGGDVTYSPVKEYYDPGDEVQLTATANPGYRFDQWEGTGIVDPNNSSTSITMDENKTVTAHFVARYTLTVEASNGGMTDPAAPGVYTYDAGTPVWIGAFADVESGYYFGRWGGDGYSNPIGWYSVIWLEVIMDSDKAITAFFTHPPSNVSVSPNGGRGSRETFTLIYRDEDGFEELEWMTLRIDASVEGGVGDVTLDYFRSTNSIRMYDDAGNPGDPVVVEDTASDLSNSWGTIEVSKIKTSGSGTDFQLEVPIIFNVDFAGEKNLWAYCEDAFGGESNQGENLLMGSYTVVPITVIQPNGGEELLRKNPYVITWDSADGVGNVDIVLYKDGLELGVITADCPNTGSYEWNVGELTVPPGVAPAGSGYTIRIQETSNPLVFDDSDPFTIKLEQYRLTVIIDPADGRGGTTLEPYTPGDHEVDEGTSVTVEAQENAGYRFSGWSGAVISPDRAITFTMDGPKTITANFKKTYTLTVEASNGGMTDPVAPGVYTYDAGTTVRIHAVADVDSGYYFGRWGGDVYSNPIGWYTSISLDVIMDSHKAITAFFTHPPSNVSVSPNGGRGSFETFTAVYRDSDGFGELEKMTLWIDGPPGGLSGDVAFQYFRSTNTIRMFNDAGIPGAPVFVGPGAGDLSNSQGTIEVSKIKTSGSGTDFQLEVPIIFKPAFAGEKSLRMYCEDAFGGESNHGANSLMGSYTVVTLTVIQPNGGEPLLLGDPYVINWSSAGGVGNVDIVLYKDGQKLGIITADCLNTGSREWNVGDLIMPPGVAPAGSGYTIRIQETSNPLVFDDSDAPFTIIWP